MKWRLGLLPVALAVMLLSSCSTTASNQPVIGPTELVGTWANGHASMTFSSDHSVLVHNVNVAPGNGECGVLRGTGTWQFLSARGESGQSPQSYKRGDLIGIDPVSLPENCGAFEVTTWGPSSAVTLCIDSDPDSPCTSTTFSRKDNPPRTTPKSFVGEWYVHDGRLTVGSQLTGSEMANQGPSVVEVDTLRFASVHGGRLSAVITKISFVDVSTKRETVNPSPNDSQAVGDSFLLAHVNPHLLKTIYVRSSLPTTDLEAGNPYWCGPGPHHWVPKCGA
jgi:hypothetical protein